LHVDPTGHDVQPEPVRVGQVGVTAAINQHVHAVLRCLRAVLLSVACHFVQLFIRVATIVVHGVHPEQVAVVFVEPQGTRGVCDCVCIVGVYILLALVLVPHRPATSPAVVLVVRLTYELVVLGVREPRAVVLP